MLSLGKFRPEEKSVNYCINLLGCLSITLSRTLKFLLAKPNIETPVLFWLSVDHLEKQIHIYFWFFGGIVSNRNRYIFIIHSHFEVCE